MVTNDVFQAMRSALSNPAYTDPISNADAVARWEAVVDDTEAQRLLADALQVGDGQMFAAGVEWMKSAT